MGGKCFRIPFLFRICSLDVMLKGVCFVTDVFFCLLLCISVVGLVAFSSLKE